MKLKPEDFQKIEDKKLANVLRKLHAGKTLTARDEAILAQARAGEEPSEASSQTSGDAPDLSGYVGTWDELAQRLGVSRRAIQDWRSDPRYQPVIEERRAVLERADGRHCVAEWQRLMVDLHLNRGRGAAGETEPGELRTEDSPDDEAVLQPPRLGGRQDDWIKAKLAKDVERKGIEIDEIKGTLLEAAELEVPLGATFAAIQIKLAQFPARVARYLVGLRDIGEVEDRLRDEIDADLGDLNAARFAAETAVADAVAALPFDENSEQLFTKVCFTGQDRAALLQLIAAVATQALRQLGTRAIAIAQREAITPDTAIADDVTGQVTDEAAARESAAQSAPIAAQPAPKRQRKPRPKPAPPPPMVEAAIVNKRRAKTRRPRR